MTLTPFTNRNAIEGIDGPAYEVPLVCAAPDCGITWGIERHHLVRRSLLGGAYDWIAYEGVPIQNKVGLCKEHHREVTDNEVAIRWSDLGHFVWLDAQGSAKLDPHPVIGIDMMRIPYEPPQLSELCPTCKRPRRTYQSRVREPVRARKAWTIHVPADEREQGADVLDTLLESARELMGHAGLPYGNEEAARYYVLAAALGLFVQHAKEVLE